SATARLGAIVALAATGHDLGFGPFLLVHSGSLALGNLALAFAARQRLPAPAPPLPGFFARAWPLAGSCSRRTSGPTTASCARSRARRSSGATTPPCAGSSGWPSSRPSPRL